jgi:phosphocarrier protein
VVSLAREFDAELRISKGGHSVNGRSILELMTLSASLGSELELSASGDDAGALITALSELISAGFAEND